MYIVQIDHPHKTEYREHLFFNLADAQRFYKEEMEKALKEKISGITVTLLHKLEEFYDMKDMKVKYWNDAQWALFDYFHMYLSGDHCLHVYNYYWHKIYGA